MTDATSFLLERLHAAGLTDVVAVEPAAGGLAATAGLARRGDGTSVFVKGFVKGFVEASGEPTSDDVFAAEAEGLTALREAGGVATPEIVLAGRDLLVLSVLRPRPGTEAFWERFAHALAHLHTTTRSPASGGTGTTGWAVAGRSTPGMTTGSRSSPSTVCCAGSASLASRRRSAPRTRRRWSGCATGCPSCCRSGPRA
ncbi:hypothetical protein GCM10027612_48240 [Microbispora bryophytorum subsp. camponoti]